MQRLFLLLIFNAILFTTFASNSNTTISIEECDQIFLKDGREISAKILEVNLNAVKYRQCNFKDGPIQYISKKDIVLLKYSNGNVEVIKNSNNVPDSERRTLPSSIFSMVFGIMAFFVPFTLGLIFGGLAIILGGLAIKKIKNNEGYRGIKMARAGMILGIILIGLFLIAIMGGGLGV